MNVVLTILTIVDIILAVVIAISIAEFCMANKDRRVIVSQRIGGLLMTIFIFAVITATILSKNPSWFRWIARHF